MELYYEREWDRGRVCCTVHVGALGLYPTGAASVLRCVYRLRRMRGESGDDDLGIPSAPVGEPTGGYAARRKRLKDKRRDGEWQYTRVLACSLPECGTRFYSLLSVVKQ